MCLPKEQWIWLDDKLYPNQQTTIINGFQPDDGSFAVAEFIRKYDFEKQIVQAKLRFSGDTEYRLLCNGEFVATGPATIAGDFMCNDAARPWHYATQVNLPVNGNTLELYARVKLKPSGLTSIRAAMAARCFPVLLLLQMEHLKRLLQMKAGCADMTGVLLPAISS